MINKEDAIKIAAEKVKKDGIINLEGRDQLVVDEGNAWHITFPLAEESIGGEPHIIIDKETGYIIKSYYTQ